jgi:hypothetical protein
MLVMASFGFVWPFDLFDGVEEPAPEGALLLLSHSLKRKKSLRMFVCG